MSVRITREFPSLRSCLQYIESSFHAEVAVHGRNREDGTDLGPVAAPAYLFRGESARHKTTTATMQRISTEEHLGERSRKLLPGLVEVIVQRLASFLSLSKMDAAGFARHYGLPTELLDLTSSPDVAGFFASEGRPGSKGLVAVFSTRILAKSTVLIDLRDHHAAARPRKQEAFTVFSKRHLDLKSEACINELKSQWFGFTLTKEDREYFQEKKADLIGASTDPVAGVVQLVVDSMVSQHGPLPTEIAKWLSGRIAAAPFVTRPYKQSEAGELIEVELVPASSVGLEFDEEQEQERNYRIWSGRSESSSKGRLELTQNLRVIRIDTDGILVVI